MPRPLPPSWIVIQISLIQLRHRVAAALQRYPLLPALVLVGLLLLSFWWQWSTHQLVGQLSTFRPPVLKATDFNRYSQIITIITLGLVWGLHLLTPAEEGWRSHLHLPLRRRDWLLGSALLKLGLGGVLAILLVTPLWSAIFQSFAVHTTAFAWYTLGVICLGIGSLAGLTLAAAVDRLIELFPLTQTIRYLLRQIVYAGFWCLAIYCLLRYVLQPDTGLITAGTIIFGNVGQVVIALQLHTGWLAPGLQLLSAGLFWALTFWLLGYVARPQLAPRSSKQPHFSQPTITNHEARAITSLVLKQGRRDTGMWILVGLFTILPLGSALIVRAWNQPVLTLLYAQLTLVLIPLAIAFLPIRLRWYLGRKPRVAHFRPVHPLVATLSLYGIVLVAISALDNLLWLTCYGVARIPLHPEGWAGQLGIGLAVGFLSALFSWVFLESLNEFDIALPHGASLMAGLIISCGLLQSALSHPALFVSLVVGLMALSVICSWALERRNGGYA